MNEIKQPRSTQQKSKTLFKSAYQERGQAMVETAFVMIILLLLLSVIIDLGRAFFTYLALQNAVGEGAYYAAKDPDPNEIRFRVRHESPDSPGFAGAPLFNWEGIEDDDIDVTFWCPPTPVDLENPTADELARQRTNITVPSGAFAVVSVTYQFQTIGPVAGMLAVAYSFAGDTIQADYWDDWDGTFALRAETKQIVLYEGSSAHVDCN